MHQKLKRALAMTTALAAVGSVTLITASTASAAPGDPVIPGLTITLPSGTIGTNTTTFSLTLPADNGCPGNGASDGYRWQQYIVSAAVDPGTLTYGASGPILPGGAPVGSIAQPLYSPTQSPQVNKTSIGAASPYTISGTSTLNLDVNRAAGLVSGDYKVGFACSKAGVTHKFWSFPITVNAPTPTPSAALYWAASPGVAPVAPTGLTAVGTTTDGGTITGLFNPVVAAVPAVSGYTVTATPVGGGTAVSTSVPAAGPFTYSLTVPNSLPLYNVTVTATNSIGTGPAATVANLLVAPAQIGAPEPVTGIDGIEEFTVNWTTPTAPVAAVLQNYTVTVTPSVAGSPFTVAAGTNTLLVTAPQGTYSVTVKGNYAAPFTSATSTAITVRSGSNRVVVQDITVTRPKGALVLTQRCGVYGSAIAYSDNVFGSLPLLPAVPANADPDNDNLTPANPADDFYNTLPAGSAPKNDSAPFNPNTGVTTDDTLFPQYPYPTINLPGDPTDGDSVATYPTNCGITLDTPRLITSGPKAGQYFRTTGRIAQLTVVNTQNVDEGWTLNGTMGNFSNGTDSFSGNLMGWDPEVTWDSLANLDGYNMTVTAGGRRQPEATASTTGLGAAFNATNTVLASSLAKSNGFATVSPTSSTGSLGMAVLDARLRLLVPVAADEGVYKGALTFTIV